VKTGRQAAGWVEILEGIGPTAKVVASGGAFLNEGDMVRVVDTKPNALPAKSHAKNH
jgi:hypothetical protein